MVAGGFNAFDMYPKNKERQQQLETNHLKSKKKKRDAIIHRYDPFNNDVAPRSQPMRLTPSHDLFETTTNSQLLKFTSDSSSIKTLPKQ